MYVCVGSKETQTTSVMHLLRYFNINIVMDLNHLEAIKVQLKDFFVLSIEISRLKLPYKKYFSYNAIMWVESISFIDFSSFQTIFNRIFGIRLNKKKGGLE